MGPEEWIGVLAFSSKYCFKVGVDAALSVLQRPFLPGGQEFAPCYKLRLAWTFDIEDWYMDILDKILAFPPIQFTQHDFNDLGGELSETISKARVRASRHRLELIPFIPEAQHHAGCVDRGRCGRDWANAYSTAMLFFAHTRRFYSGREVYAKLGQIEVPTVHESCRRLTLHEVSARGVLWKEEAFMQEGKDECLQLLRTTRPPKARPSPRYITGEDDRTSSNSFFTLAV